MNAARQNERSGESPFQKAFTLTDLLVVVAVIVVLAALRVSAISAEKPKSNGFQCMNDLRQLCLAWRMYAEDNHGDFVCSSDDGNGKAYTTIPPFQSQGDLYAWTWSKMDYKSANGFNTDPAADIMLRPLWHYQQNVNIYKCPGDTSVVSSNGVVRPRIRSYSMNWYLGGFGENTSEMLISGGSYIPYRRMAQLEDPVHSPGPANTFLFVEERQDCINWGNFETQMAGFPNNPNLYEWTEDVPGGNHNGAGGISFCDGHVELHKWQGGVTQYPIVPSVGLTSNPSPSTLFPDPNSVDVAYMQSVSTRPH